jgi:hypothetical protein
VSKKVTVCVECFHLTFINNYYIYFHNYTEESSKIPKYLIKAALKEEDERGLTVTQKKLMKKRPESEDLLKVCKQIIL